MVFVVLRLRLFLLRVVIVLWIRIVRLVIRAAAVLVRSPVILISAVTGVFVLMIWRCVILGISVMVRM
jgi:hypothetical protein